MHIYNYIWLNVFFYILSHLFGVPSCGQTRDGSRTCWCYRRRYRYRKRRNVYWLILLFLGVYCYSGSWTLGRKNIMAVSGFYASTSSWSVPTSRFRHRLNGTFTISWPSLRDQGMIIWHSGRRMHIAADVSRYLIDLLGVFSRGEGNCGDDL